MIINDKRKSDDLLAIREAQYRELLNNMDEEVIIEDADGKLIYVNDTYCRYYGITREEAIGRKGTDIVIPEDRFLYDRIRKLTPSEPEYRLECRVRRANGNIVWLECTGKGFFDKDGKLVECQEVARDITEIKNKELFLTNQKNFLESVVEEKTKEVNKMNRQLIELNGYLNNILQSISEGVVVFNEHGSVQMTNSAFDEYWKDNKELLLRELADNIKNRKDSYLYKLLNKGELFNDREFFSAIRNKSIHCFISGQLLNSDMSGTKRCVLIIRPINEVRQIVARFSGFQSRFTFDDIVADSLKMKTIIEYAKAISCTESNVLITGESGTGKEMFAQSIHAASDRKKGPFIGVNCGAIPGELIGSELFGYVEGAFTGAKKSGKPGKFELAFGGTIFLDEIGDMPLAQQIMLLRVIQERKVTRIGDDREIDIDTRIICATNKNLYEEVKMGNFREDLFYRLNVMHIEVPTLRERSEDIPVLIKYFIGKHFENEEMDAPQIDDEAMRRLCDYSWPGNIRELQNMMERISYMVMADKIKKVTLEYLVTRILGYSKGSGILNYRQITQSDIMRDEVNNCSVAEERLIKKEKLEEKDKQLLLKELRACDYNISKAAKALGVSRKTVYAKIKKYEIE